jgi:hypothetical protein
MRHSFADLKFCLAPPTCSLSLSTGGRSSDNSVIKLSFSELRHLCSTDGTRVEFYRTLSLTVTFPASGDSAAKL